MNRFYKYQGTGNDFVVIDHFTQPWLDLSDNELIKLLCDRRFGIGADGLIALLPTADADFEMQYFNADGLPGSLCGNGSRCAVACMHHLGRLEGECNFLAYDGPHQGHISDDGNFVEIRMNDVTDVESGAGFYVLDTGSPHYVTMVEDLDDLDVYDLGQKIRYSDRFREKGVNVNFVEVQSETLAVATYERGVEAETLSCGTGVTAAALAASIHQQVDGEIRHTVETRGGRLIVRFAANSGSYTDIWLGGPAKLVFTGSYPR